MRPTVRSRKREQVALGQEGPRSSTIEAVLAAGGEVGRLMQETDWAATALGPMDGWKQSLQSALSICLSSRFPIVMYWGRELTVLYNDAYSLILGDKHPWALGKPCEVCWAEIWDTIGPMLNGVVTTGVATWSDDLELLLERHGVSEECYFSFSFSPVRVETGEVGGVFTAVVETTHRVLSDRRLRILSQIGELSVGARSAEEACRRCIDALDGTRTVPFALAYLCDYEAGAARLVESKGLHSSSRLLANAVSTEDPGAVWPLREAALGAPVIVDLAADDVRPIAGWTHDVAPARAVVLPVGLSEPGRVTGFLIAAVNPLRPLDSDYQAFYELLAKQVSGAVADAQAYEDERHRAEALAELDRAKTEFFSNVSHEFRTPLTLLIGPLEALVEQTEPGSPQAAEVELALRNALRLLKLVNTLLDFSRVEAMRKDIAFEPVDLAVYTGGLANIFRSAVERAGLRLVVDCQPLDEPVLIDRDMWEKVVLNLLSNALKFTLEGEITVRVARKDGQAVLTVADTGIGIPADGLPHIFERFYRIQETRSRNHEGAGIGLALVKQLIEMLGGTIDVSSTPGVGTQFTVRLPFGADRFDPEQVHKASPHQPSRVGQSTYLAEAMGWLNPGLKESGSTVTSSSPEMPGRILLVDDNSDMRDYVYKLLRERWDVETAADGLQALEAVGRRRPDLVLTDVMMPRMDGFELMESLRADPASRDIPVIMLSARAGEESTVEGLNRGADDYLVKPFSASELIARVRTHLGMAAMRTEMATARAEIALAADRNSFLNMAAHELRTPLTVIRGYVDLILSGAVDWQSDTARHALEKVSIKAVEGGRLVEQMLLAARAESGSIGINTADLDLQVLAREAVDRASALAAVESKEIWTELGEVPVPVTVDGALISLVLDNLISNALLHGDGVVSVRVLADPPRVRVADNGSGIANEMQDKIFEPFVQLEEGHKLKGGVGLGLAVSRRLAELHGGSLILEKTRGGASFLLTLPATDRGAAADSPDRTNPSELESLSGLD